MRVFMTALVATAGVELPSRKVPGMVVRGAAAVVEGVWKVVRPGTMWCSPRSCIDARHAPLPQDPNWIPRDFRVGRDDGVRASERLANQHSIERISMQ